MSAPPRPGRIAAAVVSLQKAGVDPATVREVVQRAHVGPVLTALMLTSRVGGVNGQPDYLYLRRAGYTLIRVLARLDDFRNGPISAEALAQMDAGFASMRRSGLKAQLGFSYNFPSSWDVSNPPPDAPLAIVLGHLDQLGPVFERNKDVIASMSRGFIGAWGEGHAEALAAAAEHYGRFVGKPVARE